MTIPKSCNISSSIVKHPGLRGMIELGETFAAARQARTLIMAKLVPNFVHVVEILVFDLIPRKSAL